MTYLLLALLTLPFSVPKSDSLPPPAREQLVGTWEEMPAFPGCEILPAAQWSKCSGDNLKSFLESNLRWPAPDWCGQGIAVVQITVDKTGSLVDPKIVRDLGGPSTEEVWRVTNLLFERYPVWSPGGIHRGRRAAVTFNWPIKFVLH
ncbi:energy transducer TonB [Neolewinella antarctica]|uniref:Uncharacterized protein n=1 Tax=Neolewinella antarctica TaxID=442734 RepID=A0ABX0XFV3_9BACT|nr:hypothetical protein [Neolewinella antarctica]NJC27632.1 hypothetical protein [Neolewinella antarctica]